METEGSLLCSEKPATDSYPEPHESFPDRQQKENHYIAVHAKVTVQNVFEYVNQQLKSVSKYHE
jgi:uncharacterized lipoprotein YbaY